MISPAVALIVVVAFFPVVYSIYMSLHDATVTQAGELGRPGQLRRLAFEDPDFRAALANTMCSRS